MPKPPHAPNLLGVHHVALQVFNYEATRQFYTECLGMAVEWEPDSDNVYLTSGTDNLALHRTGERADSSRQRLDHIGFVVRQPKDVDAWAETLTAYGVEILEAARTHRDGARSLYCVDPDGTKVQIIYHPPLSGDYRRGGFGLQATH